MNQIEPNSNSPAFNVPRIIVVFIGIFCAAHFYRLQLSPLADARLLYQYGFIPAAFIQNNALYWFTPLSYAFLHGNLTHLVLNSLWFLAFGSVVARHLGAGRFALFFALTSIVSAVFYGLLHANLVSPMIGASGAVSGAMAAALLLSPNDVGTIMPLSVAVRDKRILATTLLWVVINIASGFGANPGIDNNVQIAWEAHLAGFFSGMLLIGSLSRLKSYNL